MKVLATKKIPSIGSLIEMMRQDFSDQYSYKSIGIGKHKSIIVQKSTFVGVQISVNKNEIIIDEAVPTIKGIFINFLLQFFLGLAVSIMQFGSPFFKSSPWRKFKNEVVVYLRHKFN